MEQGLREVSTVTLHGVLAPSLRLMSEISFCRPSPLAINPKLGCIHTCGSSITAAVCCVKVVCWRSVVAKGSGQSIYGRCLFFSQLMTVRALAKRGCGTFFILENRKKEVTRTSNHCLLQNIIFNYKNDKQMIDVHV